MGISNEIPFLPEGGVVTTLEKGWALGQEFNDPRTSYKYQLYQISTALTNDTFADGEVAVLESEGVVTNDVSAGQDATNPEFAGIACAALAESTSGGTTRYALFLTDGVKTNVKTDGGDDIALGDLVVADETVDGAVDRAAQGSDIFTTAGKFKSIVGRTKAADVDAADIVSVSVRKLFR